MSTRSVLRRATSQPIRHRMLQAVNAGLVSTFGQRMNISHLVEYPKCGGTWVKNMMQHYIGGKPYYVDRIVSPGTVMHVHRLYSRRFSRPVVLFRDPRDVFVSYFFYERTLQTKGVPLALDALMDLRGKDFDPALFYQYLEAKLVRRTDPYFTLREFFDSWWGRDDVFYTQYEAFKHDARGELSRLVAYLGHEPDPQKIHDAVDYYTFENVTKRKFGRARQSGEEDPNSMQRKGISGDWVNHFDARCMQLIDHALGDVIIELGYEKDRSWLDTAAPASSDAAPAST